MNRKDLGAVLAIVGCYAAMMLLGITCPIRFFTGISCAGCGMTRAWLSLLRLDLSAAFAFHPLFWLTVPSGVALLLRRRIKPKVFRGCMAVVVTLFLVVYLARLISPADTVVVFAPSEGLLWRLAARFWETVSRR